MKISSTNGVRDHILVLERKGYLLRKASRARGLLPVWEKVEALGMPCPVSVEKTSENGAKNTRSTRSKRQSQGGKKRTRDIKRVPIIGTAS